MTTLTIDLNTFKSLSNDRQWEAVNDKFDEAMRAIKRTGNDPAQRKAFINEFNARDTAAAKYGYCLYICASLEA